MKEEDRAKAMQLIESRSFPEPNSGCWLWDAGCDGDGYGWAMFDGHHMAAHRLSYVAHSGPIPAGHAVLHSCDVSLCVNPAHLTVGTITDNNAERDGKGRSGRGNRSWRVRSYAAPRKPLGPLTQALLRSLVSYDAETGEFRWLERDRDYRFNAEYAGKIAGWRDPGGYWRLSFDGRGYWAHRVAWMYVHGCWPRYELDHINADKADNRLVNLREASHAQNGHNTGLRRNNTSGHKGVSFVPSRGQWQATITVNGKMRHLGRFERPEDAVAARKIAEAEHHGAFAAIKGHC